MKTTIMKTIKYISKFIGLIIAITLLISCSENNQEDDLIDPVSDGNSFYELKINGVTYENKAISNASAIVVKGIDEETKKAINTTSAFIENEQIRFNAVIVKIDEQLKSLESNQEEYSTIIITLNNKMYFSKTGTITIKKEKPYGIFNLTTDQVGAGKTAILFEFSGTFIDVNETEIPISGKINIAKEQAI
ncbi:hypothetical protein F7647_09950 [Tenacibaculum piscium]|uniref:hypothetical protein n=2 Tax=Tenacibaculum piscium TaxID=1458515 RepID=UPI00187B4B53|nr:hypothetical protein [Tenacibaculum piscium]MBE7686369.1 hypothetical protein [Tenacibaculum piscium]MBE7691052.1 hypothetical protein [Tenacibaculum piscium]